MPFVCMSAQIEQALHGAHDADRTRDLVLTKDVLYQLSYVGTPIKRESENVKRQTGRPSLCYGLDVSRFTSHVSSLERAMGFEPTTASLEGWNSTTELRPPFSSSVLSSSCSGCIRSLSTRHLPASFMWWAGKDSNLGSRWQQIYSLPPLATWVPARNTLPRHKKINPVSLSLPSSSIAKMKKRKASRSTYGSPSLIE